jgi:hypothetical protein
LAARTLPSAESSGAELTPASGGRHHSPTISRYNLRDAIEQCHRDVLAFGTLLDWRWQSRCASITTLCLVSGVADGGPPSADLMTRTGKQRSNNFPDAASKSRNASAVAGRLPAWIMSSV